MNHAHRNKILLKQGEVLCTTTVRITTITAEGHKYTGTGFYYSIDDKGLDYTPVIIASRHLLWDAETVEFVFTKADQWGNNTKEKFTSRINKVNLGILHHPDEYIDLCALNLTPVVENLRLDGIEIFNNYITRGLIITPELVSGLDAIEDILMIGYPDGLWDSVNNQPLVRKGITATHPKLDYNAFPEFLIDAACFEGSSGSPVFYFNKSFKTEIEHGQIGFPVYLIGILSHGATKQLNETNDSLDSQTNKQIQINLNLGYVIKANQLLILDDLIRNDLSRIR